MNKLEILENLLDFLPELFPPDLSAITLSNCTHFTAIWGRHGNTLGQSLKTFIYPGKPLDSRVMLGKVMMEKRKITKYFTKEESISGIPYLAIGVPIYEGEQIIGGIAVVREETILETQERCKLLLEVQDTLYNNMAVVSSKLSDLVNMYSQIRKITDFVQTISQKAHLIKIQTSMEASQKKGYNETIISSVLKDLKSLANESKDAAENIVALLNDFDEDSIKLFAAIRHIETSIFNMSFTLDNIMNYLAKQSNTIINGK